MAATPGKKALEVMKSMEKNIVEFKKPIIPKKKVKIKILNEERYIEELAKIIQRDFFPDLEKLKAQNDYLDALERNDVIKLREIYAKYSGTRPKQSSAGQSPATFETPQSSSNSTPRTKSPTPSLGDDKSKENSKKGKSIADNHSLDSFLSTYTSEDNYSFQEIIETADQKLRQKFSVLFNEELVSAEKLARVLALPSIEDQFGVSDPERKIETWSYKNKNYIMYIPEGVDLTKEEKMEMVNKKEEISYCNTRLNKNPFNESQNKEAISEVAKTQAKNLTGKIGVDGNILEPNPGKVFGFDFVKTPSPCPGESCSPLMTWGEIEGTPFRLDGSDTPVRASVGPSFRINETSRREAIALELAEKAGERLRGQKQKAMDAARRNIGSPYMKSSIERLASMSPAAKRLATMKLGLRTSVLSPSPDRTPNRLKSLSKPTPSPIVRKKTPLVITHKTALTESHKSDLTDDLLNIPSKRLKASDFF